MISALTGNVQTNYTKQTNKQVAIVWNGLDTLEGRAKHTIVGSKRNDLEAGGGV
jgi:hypothetical protein